VILRKSPSRWCRDASSYHGYGPNNDTSACTAIDLRKFPPDQHERFVSSVTHGKNQMPPWGDLLSAADVEALWAYVMAGEPR
jgi:hypothetical protein